MPIAGLLKDLKQRGMLDDTLVVWGTECGRTPAAEGDPNATGAGRNHHPYGFSGTSSASTRASSKSPAASASTSTSASRSWRFLRKTERKPDAEKLEARAKAIRATVK
jgi:hypothetical protein